VAVVVMTARILAFAARGPFAVHVAREDDEAAWLVVCREHGWLCGSHPEAIAEARGLARGFGVAVVVEARS
jgi:hypothetical protein